MSLFYITSCNNALNQLNKAMTFRSLIGRTAPLALLIVASLAIHSSAVGDIVTREYVLKNVDGDIMIRVLNILVEDKAKRRLMGSTGRKLVVTDTIAHHNAILELLPVLDIPQKETIPNRIVLSLMGTASQHMQKQGAIAAGGTKGAAAPLAAGNAKTPDLWKSGVGTYDAYKSTWSIYAEEDAKLSKIRRIKEEGGALPSFNDLALKGIFQSANGAPMGILSYGLINFTARDGALYERNRSKVQGVTTEVHQDRVILTGPDKRPRVYKFKSTL